MENIPIDPIPINDSFRNEKLENINVSGVRVVSSWFVDYANFMVRKVMPPQFNSQQRKKFFNDLFGMILFCMTKV
jgi:hypothetical protein